MGNLKNLRTDTSKWKFLTKQNEEPNYDVSPVGPVIINYRKTFKSYQNQSTKQNNPTRNSLLKLDELESNILRNPLQLFPYLLQYLPVSVSKTVIDLLDHSHKEQLKNLIKLTKHQNINEDIQPKTDIKSANQPNDCSVSNSNVASSVISMKSKIEAEDSIEPEMFIEFPSIKEETLAFCEFVKNLDGSPDDNPEPTTLASLFAGTHEAQPPVSTPINVVELINLPYELRNSVKEPPKLLRDKQSLTDSTSIPRVTKSNAARKQEKNFERFHYGAWYIPPKQWKVIRSDNVNKLNNKNEINDVKMKSYKELMENLNDQMKETHGYNAFMEFLQNKNKQVPKFMKF
ncbi:protein FAM47E-like [Schistosoma japonicum]|nr:protein FAM47E-like [Schistosoma japonicum]